MPPGPSAKQKVESERRRWEWIGQSIATELSRFARGHPASVRVGLLKRMLGAVGARDGVALIDAGTEYVKRFRVLPPGLYGFHPGPGRTLYFDGDRLDPGALVKQLSLGVVHPQIYR